MSLLRNILIPATLGFSLPSAALATENNEPVTVNEPIEILEPEIEPKYSLPSLDYFPREFLNSIRGSELESITVYQRSYTWNYEVMGESLNGYSLKRSYNDATGLRSRYVEIGVVRPIGNSDFTLRVAGARASGQTGPEELGYGAVASIGYRIAF